MASQGYNMGTLWSEVMVSTENDVKEWVDGFDIVTCKEHRTTGDCLSVGIHDWQIFSVVAIKQ